MTIEQMLEKLEHDKNEAERVRNETYLKAVDILSQMKEDFYLTCILDDEMKRKYDSLVSQETMACLQIGDIITTIDEIKKRL